MKNLPDKIYIQPDAHDRWFEGDKPNDNFVEYVSKDAFIEKSIKYVANHFLAPGMDNEIKDFVNYMKGE